MTNNDWAIDISTPEPSGQLLRQSAAIVELSGAAIPRRAFLLGAAASAATLLGSSFLIAGNNAKANTEKEAAIQGLMAKKNEEIAALNAKKEFAIRKAEADKYV